MAKRSNNRRPQNRKEHGFNKSIHGESATPRGKRSRDKRAADRQSLRSQYRVI